MQMFLQLNHPPVSFDSFTPFMDPSLVVELASVADNLRRLKVVHLNSTAIGGGVAEILQSMVPFSNSVGIETERIVITPLVCGVFPSHQEDSQSLAWSRRQIVGVGTASLLRLH